MKTYEEYRELVLEQEQQSNSDIALQNKYAALKKQYDALIDKQEGVEEKKTKAEEGIKVAQAKLEIAQKDLESKQIEAEPLIDQEENIETQIATLEKKIEQLQLTAERNKKAEKTTTDSEDKYGKARQDIADEDSLKAQGLQTNSKHKNLNDFISEGMGIESVLDLDYAHGSKTDTEIHVRFTPAGGTNTADIDTNVPIPITDGYIRREDIITYIQKNLSKFITKFPEGTPPEENEQERNNWLKKRVSVVLSDSIKTYDKIYVDKNVVELTVKEDDDNIKSGFPVLIVSLSAVGKQVMKAKLGSKTMGSLADKAMGKIMGFVKNNTNPKGFMKGGGLL